jgi:hypothetical protein
LSIRSTQAPVSDEPAATTASFLPVLAVADFVLDLSEAAADRAPSGAQRQQRGRSRNARFAGLSQRGEFRFDVGALLRIMDALLLDLEDRELVDQLARRHLHLDRHLMTRAPLGDCLRNMG